MLPPGNSANFLPAEAEANIYINIYKSEKLYNIDNTIL